MALALAVVGVVIQGHGASQGENTLCGCEYIVRLLEFVQPVPVELYVCTSANKLIVPLDSGYGCSH